MGYTFQASQYMNGYHFYIKSISMGYLFHPKSIWMGKIWKLVYEWGQFSKIVYEWGQFSIWEVYEWVMFFTWPGIWMGWGSGTPAAHPYPKSWQVTPPVSQSFYTIEQPVRDLHPQMVIKERIQITFDTIFRALTHKLFQTYIKCVYSIKNHCRINIQCYTKHQLQTVIQTKVYKIWRHLWRIYSCTWYQRTSMTSKMT